MSDPVGVLSGGSLSEGALQGMGNGGLPGGSYVRDGNVLVQSDNNGDQFFYPAKWADQGVWVRFDNKADAEKAHGMDSAQLQSFLNQSGGTVMAGADKLPAGPSALNPQDQSSSTNQAAQSVLSSAPGNTDYQFANPRPKKKKKQHYDPSLMMPD